MTGARDDGDCDDYDDSSLEFLYSRTLDKSAILFALFEYLSEVFFYFVAIWGYDYWGLRRILEFLVGD